MIFNTARQVRRALPSGNLIRGGYGFTAEPPSLKLRRLKTDLSAEALGKTCSKERFNKKPSVSLATEGEGGEGGKGTPAPDEL